MVEVRQALHGVGLLRVSLTPVTVAVEEYVVFVRGDMVERGFESWAEAMDYFRLCMIEAVT